jgi:hypothetical protein
VHLNVTATSCPAVYAGHRVDLLVGDTAGRAYARADIVGTA